MRKNIPIKSEIIWKNFGFFVVLFLTFFCGNIHPVLADPIHNSVEQVEISPHYTRDKTLFIITQGNLLKSSDEGSTWKRIVRGLDVKTDLSKSVLAISPRNQQLLFLGTQGDGIYKSINGGSSWFKVNNGLETLNIDAIRFANAPAYRRRIRLGGIAISPDADEVILATGKDKKLYQTKDGAETWKPVFKDSYKITAIAFTNNPEQALFIGNKKGILYSYNPQTKSWIKKFVFKNVGAITAIAFSPNFVTDKTFFLGTERGGLFKTVNNGLSFSRINKSLVNKKIFDIVITENLEHKLNLLLSTSSGIFASKDSGNNWNQWTNKLIKNSNTNKDKTKTIHFNDLAISKAFDRDKTILLASSKGLFESTDNGSNWRKVETLSTRIINSFAISPNYKNDSTLALATYVGEAYISNDKGTSWKPISKGLEVPRLTKNFQNSNQDPRQFFDIAFSPNYQIDRTLFLSLFTDKIFRSLDSGKHWDIITLPKQSNHPTFGITIVPSPNFASDRTIYLGTQQGMIYKSTDGGLNFYVVGDVGKKISNDPLSLVISPDFKTDKILYVSGPQGIHKSLDGGKTWNSVSSGIELETKRNIQLAISPNYKSDQTVIVGTNSGLFETKDGGNTWFKLASGSYGEDAYIEGVAISPHYQKDKTFIVSVRGQGLFKTVDDGQTFKQIGKDWTNQNHVFAKLNNIPSVGIPLKFSPAYATDRTIYGFGSTGGEIYRSTDGGNHWQTLVVPQYKPSQIEKLFTFISLSFFVYPLLKFVTAAIASGASYLLLRSARVEKKLLLRKFPIKIGISLVVFVIVLVLLSV